MISYHSFASNHLRSVKLEVQAPEVGHMDTKTVEIQGKFCKETPFFISWDPQMRVSTC